MAEEIVWFKGWPIKIEDGKIYQRYFPNYSKPWEWRQLIDLKNISDDLRKFLKDKNLI